MNFLILHVSMRMVRVSFLVFEFSCTCSQKNSRAKHKLENLHLEPHDYQLAPVVQKVDSTIHRIILYPLDSAIGFPNIYPMDSSIQWIVQLVSLIFIRWIALSIG